VANTGSAAGSVVQTTADRWAIRLRIAGSGNFLLVVKAPARCCHGAASPASTPRRMRTTVIAAG
jgi:hypothetical protein